MTYIEEFYGFDYEDLRDLSKNELIDYVIELRQTIELMDSECEEYEEILMSFVSIAKKKGLLDKD